MIIKPDEIILARDMHSSPPKLKPKVDMVISKIVGKTIYVTDPRLIKLIAKWKSAKRGHEDKPDNYLEDPAKIKELKQALSVSL